MAARHDIAHPVRRLRSVPKGEGLPLGKLGIARGIGRADVMKLDLALEFRVQPRQHVEHQRRVFELVEPAGKADAENPVLNIEGGCPETPRIDRNRHDLRLVGGA
jgi:hypothetical protein